jgi:hypothetical protein
MINFNLGMNDNNQNENLINFNHLPQIELSDIVNFESSRERSIEIEVPDLEINDKNNNGGNQDLIQNNNHPTLILNQNNYPSIKIERENNIILISNTNNRDIICIDINHIHFNYNDNEFKILWNDFKKIKILSNVSLRMEFNYLEFLNFLNSEYAIDYVIEKRSSENYVSDCWKENKRLFINLFVFLIIIGSIGSIYNYYK